MYDIAERYHVREDTVFKGIRSGDSMYPRSHPLGSGPRPRIAITREEVAACDERRLAFYKPSPIWIRHYECTMEVFPARKSARALLDYPGQLAKNRAKNDGSLT